MNKAIAFWVLAFSMKLVASFPYENYAAENLPQLQYANSGNNWNEALLRQNSNPQLAYQNTNEIQNQIRNQQAQIQNQVQQQQAQTQNQVQQQQAQIQNQVQQQQAQIQNQVKNQQAEITWQNQEALKSLQNHAAVQTLVNHPEFHNVRNLDWESFQNHPAIQSFVNHPEFPTLQNHPAFELLQNDALQRLQPTSLPVPQYVERIFDKKRQQHLPVYYQHGRQTAAAEANANSGQYPTQPNYYPAPQRTQQVYPEHTQNIVYPLWKAQHLLQPSRPAVPSTVTYTAPTSAYAQALASSPVYPLGPVSPIPGIPAAVTDAIAAANAAINSRAAANNAVITDQLNALAAAHQLAVTIAAASGATPAPATPLYTNPAVLAAVTALTTATQALQDKITAAKTAQTLAQQKLNDAIVAITSLTITPPSGASPTPAPPAPVASTATATAAAVATPTTATADATAEATSAVVAPPATNPPVVATDPVPTVLPTVPAPADQTNSAAVTTVVEVAANDDDDVDSDDSEEDAE